jgi:hypothetical protein
MTPGTQGTAEVSFERDIRPLFRERDRRAMLFLFDLWSRDDVSRNATRILPAVRAGVMPCDDNWPDRQVELFARWIATGAAA